MSVKYQKVWNTMNELETVTSKICSAREILDCAIDAHQEHKHEKVEHLLYAVDEFLQYYLKEFDNKFKDAWKATVGDLRDDDVDDGMRPWGHSDLEYQIANNKKYEYTATGEKFPLTCDKDDPSPECKGAWNSFWEEDGNSVVGNPVSAPASPDVLAMPDIHFHSGYYHVSTEQSKELTTNTNNLSKEIESIREAGGYEWTPDPQVSRNDSTRLKYEDGWVYESPDGGKTVTKRKVGSTEKIVVKEDKPKKWVLPVEPDPSGEYFVTFPDDLLDAANLKEGDVIEWVDQGDGSYRLKKVTKPLGMDEC